MHQLLFFIKNKTLSFDYYYDQFNFFQMRFSTKNAGETAPPPAERTTSPVQTIPRKQTATSCPTDPGNSYSDFGVADYIFDLHGSADLWQQV